MKPKIGRPTKADTPPPRRLNFLKLGFAILVGLYGAVCALSPSSYRFLDRVDLVFHEAGHPIFGLFGEFIGILGGEDTLHDWNYLLGRLQLLNWDQALANLVYLLGLAALIASVLGGFYYSSEEEPDPR